MNRKALAATFLAALMMAGPTYAQHSGMGGMSQQGGQMDGDQHQEHDR